MHCILSSVTSLILFILEFAKIYERLGVTLIERGESFYQELMSNVVEDLEKRGIVIIQAVQAPL